MRRAHSFERHKKKIVVGFQFSPAPDLTQRIFLKTKMIAKSVAVLALAGSAAAFSPSVSFMLQLFITLIRHSQGRGCGSFCVVEPWEMYGVRQLATPFSAKVSQFAAVAKETDGL